MNTTIQPSTELESVLQLRSELLPFEQPDKFASRNSLPDISAEVTPEPSSVIVPAATPIRQKRKPYMSKRFQTGSVRLVGKMWYGRYWRDVPGKETRDHPLVVLGSKSEMTKPEARRKLLDIIEKEGLNNNNFLERLEMPAVPALTFNGVADS